MKNEINQLDRLYLKEMAKVFLPNPFEFIKNNEVNYECIAKGIADYIIFSGYNRLKVHQDKELFYAIYTWQGFQYKVPFKLISKYLWGRK